MINEFQLATSTTFTKAGSDVNYFLDTLRAVARSQEFQQFLTTTASAVTSLTNFLIENGKTVVVTIGLWMGFRAVQGVVSGFVALRASMMAAGVAAGSLRIAMLGLAGAATGGLALVAALAVEFFMLRKNTSETEVEQNKFQLALDNTILSLDREIKALNESNARLSRRNQLIREGKTGIEADAIMDSETAKREKQNLEQQKSDIQKKIEANNSIIAAGQATQQQNKNYYKAPTTEAGQAVADRNMFSAVPVKSSGVTSNQVQQAIKDNRELQLSLANLDQIREKVYDKEAIRNKEGSEQGTTSRYNKLQAFKKDLEDYKAANGKAKIDDLMPNMSAVNYRSDKEFDQYLASLNAKFNKRKPGFVAPDPKAEAAARAADKSEARSAIAEMNRERQDIEQQIANSRKLGSSLFDEKSLGAETLALIENVRARRDSEKVLEAEGRWRLKFKELLAEGNLKNLQPEDVQQYQDALAELEAKAARMRRDVAVNDQVAQNTAVRKEREAGIERGRILDSLREKGLQVSADLRRASEKKYIDPEQAVRDNATAKVDDVYQEEIKKAKADVAATQERIAFFQEDTTELSGVEMARQVEILLSLRAQLGTRQSILSAIQAARDQQKEEIGKGAVDDYNRSLTADAGFSRFWGEYRELGKNSADFVYGAMKSSTDNMGRAFEQFGATGKLSSRSLINSIVSDLGRLAAQSLWKDLVGFVASSFFGSNSFAGAAEFGAQGAPGFGVSAPTNFARGGVMTPHGNLPLRQYSAGGVAHSAQVAVFGEGRKPEAYVPLEDGRSIPVTVNAPSSGGGVVALTFAPSISIDSRSDQAQVGALVQKALKSYHTELMGTLQERGVV
jgi:Lambda phage tail tape-measure protein (Tape_meas_lam_C)